MLGCMMTVEAVVALIESIAVICAFGIRAYNVYPYLDTQMNLPIAKWGNSLAVRIPSEVVRRLGLREGAVVDAQLTIDGSLSIRPARWDRKVFALELTTARDAMAMSEPVMDELRSAQRY